MALRMLINALEKIHDNKENPMHLFIVKVNRRSY